MRISSISSYTHFEAQNPKNSDANPISKAGEKANLAKATFIAGLGLGVRLLVELADDGFVVDKIGEKAEQIAKKQNTKSGWKKFGIFTGLVLMAVGGFAALYTLFMAPKINYQGNVNAFKKSKDMDVYIQGNKAEKEIYTQMNEKAKNADEEEKAKLREQYMKMQMAKNKVPEFIKLKSL